MVKIRGQQYFSLMIQRVNILGLARHKFLLQLNSVIRTLEKPQIISK